MDELANTNRFAETVAVGLGVEGVESYLDTFDDIERSYFARAGLVDRRFNPKLGSRVVGHLFGLLGGGEWSLSGDVAEADGARLLTLTGNGETRLLVLPPEGGVGADDVLAGRVCSEAVDLDSGEIADAPPPTITAPSVLRVG